MEDFINTNEDVFKTEPVVEPKPVAVEKPVQVRAASDSAMRQHAIDEELEQILSKQ